MLTLDIPDKQVRELRQLLGSDVPKKLTREIIIAVNATAKKTKTLVSREIRQELAVNTKAVNKVLKFGHRASASRLSATVVLEKEKRLPLKDFSPRQTRKGVSYRTSKKAGRKTAPDAFMGARPGLVSAKLRGHVYKRLGQARKPIAMLQGASPWGAYKVNNLRVPTVKEGRRELIKQLERRVRFQRLKKSGAI